MPTLRRTHHIVAFEDTASNNPQRRAVDWRRFQVSIPVSKPKSDFLEIEPLTEVAVFDGTRSTAIDGTTELEIELSTLSTDRYRLSHTGTGTAPDFRTDRGLTLSGGDATLTVNANQTVTVTHSVGAVFGAVVVGDEVLIPGVKTGDAAGPFDALNEGRWSVIGATTTTLTLRRAAGTTFEGKTETVSVTSNDQFVAFSAAGVQEGDVIDISAGFGTSGTFKVLSVAPAYVEFRSTLALAEEIAVPGAAGIAVYSSAKQYVYIEADQEVALKLNGDSTESNRIVPFISGSAELVGIFERVGPTFSMIIKNRSSVSAHVRVITAE